MKKTINILLTNVKTLVLKNWKIPRLLLNILKIRIMARRKCNVLIVFDNMIADIISNLIK